MLARARRRRVLRLNLDNIPKFVFWSANLVAPLDGMVPSSVLRAKCGKLSCVHGSIPGIANFVFAVQREIGAALAINLIQHQFEFHNFYTPCSRCCRQIIPLRAEPKATMR